MSAPVAYYAPTTTSEAASILADEEGITVLAGGQTVVEAINRGQMRPRGILSLHLVAELKRLQRQQDGGVMIGAMVTHREIAACDALSGMHRLLALAAREIGSAAIRNAATIGGTLCRADPNLDYPAVLLALDAEIILRSKSGERVVGVSDLFGGVRQATELLVAVRLPPAPEGALVTYERLARSDQDIPIVSLAVGIEFSDDKCRQARIGVGSCGPAPVRAREPEMRLEGTALDDADLTEAAELLDLAIAPGDDIRATAAYRRMLAPRLFRRALERVRRQR